MRRSPTSPLAAGEDWDGFVALAVEEGWSGVEALSGIPGSAGATPVQNVGAYGQDVAADRRAGAGVGPAGGSGVHDEFARLPLHLPALGVQGHRPVSRLMHAGGSMPLTKTGSSMHDAIVGMSAGRLGVIGVTDDEDYLVGVITDGDLRRNIERGLDHTAAEFMTRDPKTIAPDSLVDEALTLFEENRITALFVVEDDGRGKKPVGVLHIHDCRASAMNTVILIPARYQSSRYPGKPLVELKGSTVPGSR